MLDFPVKTGLTLLLPQQLLVICIKCEYVHDINNLLEHGEVQLPASTYILSFMLRNASKEKEDLLHRPFSPSLCSCVASGTSSADASRTY